MTIASDTTARNLVISFPPSRFGLGIIFTWTRHMAEKFLAPDSQPSVL